MGAAALGQTQALRGLYVVNARHIKNALGCKTDVSDSEWLAELARCGLLRPSFVPPKDFREIRMLTRYRKKVIGMLGAEKNRLHKTLESAGIKLGSVVSDIDGVSAREIGRNNQIISYS